MPVAKVNPTPAGGKTAKVAPEDSVTPTNKNAPPVSKKIADFFDSTPAQATIMVFTIYALFGEDFRVATVAKSGDDVFSVISTITLVVFMVEMTAFTMAKNDYLGGFFFWLDVVSLVSLIPDIPFIWNPVLLVFDGDPFSLQDSADLSVARASRSSRAGTKAGRMIRVLALIRAFRIVRMVAQQKQEEEEGEETGEGEEPAPKEKDENIGFGMGGSQIGKRLAQITTARVVIGVLLMVILFPLLSVSLLPDSAPQAGLDGIDALVSGNHPMQGDSVFVEGQISDYIRRYTLEGKKLKLIYLHVSNITNGTRLRDQAAIESLRQNEIRMVFAHSNEYTEAWFDKSERSQIEGLVSILMTVLILALLGYATFAFSRDTTQLVIKPVERMVAFVKRLAVNPLAKIKTLDNVGGGFEIRVLENTLMRLGGLLQIGFGDAGAEIIGKNMGTNGLDPMVPGRKMLAMFGFCDIRKFADCTEYLSENTILLVNQIADIVHERVHRFQGHANKNMGNAFLLVWKCKSNFKDFKSNKNSELSDIETLLHKEPELVPLMTEMADQALLSFCHIEIKVQLDKKLDRWRNDARLTDNDWKIEMGFGLHVGWAIEGAIGSSAKIDASYLSPNVNMTARLESSTRQYGVYLLMSGVFLKLMSKEIQQRCRHLDRVTVKGSAIPIDIYTLDICLENVPENGVLGQDKELPPHSLIRLAKANDRRTKGLLGRSAMAVTKSLRARNNSRKNINQIAVRRALFGFLSFLFFLDMAT